MYPFNRPAYLKLMTQIDDLVCNTIMEYSDIQDIPPWRVKHIVYEIMSQMRLSVFNQTFLPVFEDISADLRAHVFLYLESRCGCVFKDPLSVYQPLFSDSSVYHIE